MLPPNKKRTLDAWITLAELPGKEISLEPAM